jgi:phenylalanyl-tRNA synthetase beta chain
MLVKVAAGRVDGSPMDVGNLASEPAELTLRPARVEHLLGDRVSADEITRLLRSIGFGVRPGHGEGLLVRSPSWRNDVGVESDLVEEVARLRGYDVLSDEVAPFRPSTVPDDPLFIVGNRVRDDLVAAGLVETRPMPFVRGTDETHVRVRNPLAEDEPHLRVSLLETLARRAEYNLGRMEGNIRIFEVGSAFQPRRQQLPHEEMRAGALIMGDRRPPHFTEPRPPRIDAWDAKALAERMAGIALRGEQWSLRPGTGDELWIITTESGREAGRVRRVPLDAPVWAAEAFGIEVSLGRVPNEVVAEVGAHAPDLAAPRRAAAPAIAYQPLPATPAAQFDLALLLPPGLGVAEVEGVLRSSAGELLERLTLFDEYRGNELPEGYRSVAWTLTFRDPARTLREREIEGRRAKILKSLESELGVRPRTG